MKICKGTWEILWFLLVRPTPILVHIRHYVSKVLKWISTWNDTSNNTKKSKKLLWEQKKNKTYSILLTNITCPSYLSELDTLDDFRSQCGLQIAQDIIRSWEEKLQETIDLDLTWSFRSLGEANSCGLIKVKVISSDTFAKDARDRSGWTRSHLKEYFTVPYGPDCKKI